MELEEKQKNQVLENIAKSEEVKSKLEQITSVKPSDLFIALNSVINNSVNGNISY